MNADDFGMLPRTNQAILQAFERGLISSATIMANMPAFEEACQLIHRNGLQRKIGLHLNFTSGRPLTVRIARFLRFCDASGHWRAQRMVLRLTGEEALALETEITAQVLACKQNGITPTHWDSHHHMHAQPGIAPVVIRAAKRAGVRAVRLGLNCGLGREGSSVFHRTLASAYRRAFNARLRMHRLALTEYFGDARDASYVLRATNHDIEVMVHPTLDSCGRLVDLDGQDLTSKLEGLRIPQSEMRSYYDMSCG